MITTYRAAAGIDVQSPSNTINRNISHDNEDSGIQLYNGANNCLVFDNVSYGNGDHGLVADQQERDMPSVEP